MNISAVLFMMVISSFHANELLAYKNGYHHLIKAWARPTSDAKLSAEEVKIEMGRGIATLLKDGVTAHGVNSGSLSADKIVVKDLAEHYPVLTRDSAEYVKSLNFDEILLKVKEIMADGENKIKKILRAKPAEETNTIDKNWLNKDTDSAVDSITDFNHNILGGLNYIIVLILNDEDNSKQYPILKQRYFEYVSAYVDSYINRISLSHQQFTEEDNKFEADRVLAREQKAKDKEEEDARKEAEAIIEKERLAEENARKEEARLEKEKLDKEAADKKKKATPTGAKKTVVKKPSGNNSPSTKKPTTGSPTSTKKPITQKPTTKKPAAASKQSTLIGSTNTKVADIRKAYYDAKNAIVEKHQKRLKVIMDDLYFVKSALNSRVADFIVVTPIDEEGKKIVAELIEMVKNLNTDNIFNIRTELEALRKEVNILEGKDVADDNEVEIENILIQL